MAGGSSFRRLPLWDGRAAGLRKFAAPAWIGRRLPYQGLVQPMRPSPDTCMTTPSDPSPDPARDLRERPPASAAEAATRYWGVIYAYIRQAGRRDEEARDLTQGFIADVLLGRDLTSKLDERRGQFRTLLLSAVRNYLADRYRHDHAARRQPADGRVVRNDDLAADAVGDLRHSAPEAAFHRAWISMLIRDASDALRNDCMADGRGAAWDIFESRILRPMLEGAEPASYELLMRRWGLDVPSKVSNTIVSMRRAFAGHLLRLVGTTVDRSDAAARDELRALLALMEGRSA